MTKVNILHLGHVGLFVRDLSRMAEFYRRVFGFLITDVDLDASGKPRAVFLSRNPDEHHQLVLVSRAGVVPVATVIQQISFRTESLAEVRRTYFALLEESLSQIEPITHGTAWSVYFRDPEENRIELFAETPWYITQPFVAPVDYNRSEDAILRETEELCRAQPSFRMMSEWRAEAAQRMRQAFAALTSHGPASIG